MSGRSAKRAFDDARTAARPSKASARVANPKSRKTVSIRLSDAEREHLERLAGPSSLSSYARQKLFEDTAAFKPRHTRKKRSITLEIEMLAKLLAAIGQAELHANLGRLSRAAESGALPVSTELEERLAAVCLLVEEMRRDLVAALGVRTASSSENSEA